jgi:hypothetical protein
VGWKSSLRSIFNLNILGYWELESNRLESMALINYIRKKSVTDVTRIMREEDKIGEDSGEFLFHSFTSNRKSDRG